MTQTDSRKLEAQATELLRSAACTWSGRPKSSVNPSQCEFERKSIRVPQGGMTRSETWYRK